MSRGSWPTIEGDLSWDADGAPNGSDLLVEWVKGRLLPDYQDSDTPEDERDKDKKVARSVFKYRRGRKYYLAEGKMFRAARFEAVIGSDVAEKEHLKLGSTFRATRSKASF